MRYFLLPSLVVAFLLPAGVRAQKPAKTRLDVQVGFFAGPEPGEPVDDKGRVALFKAGAWTLVYVDVQAGTDVSNAPATVAVETPDSDDVQTNYYGTRAFRDLRGPGPHQALLYTKPGGQSSDIAVTLKQEDGQSFENKKTYDALNAGDLLYLALGSHLPGLRQALWDRAKQNGDNNAVGRYRAAYVDQVATLPDRWFGYDAVDVMILSGGNQGFLEALLGDRTNRKQALAEWVRRGGRLTVSAGRYQHTMAKLLDSLFPEPLPLPVAIQGTMQLERLQSLERWVPKQPPPFVNQPLASQGGKVPPLEIARLEGRPGRPWEVLVSESDKDGSHPLVMRTAYGLGEVTLVAFDLDQGAFVRWQGQPEFWGKLLSLPGGTAAGGEQDAAEVKVERAGEALAVLLHNNLEQFEDIRVISFGWVALFIFLYILVIGPLDYFFLKKVVKRLEWTWLTFPAVVVAVSAIAYFAAYALKGHDLKVNKVDVVDIDLHTRQAFGHTWFTLFSPRIQNYTVGLEPASPGWTAGAEEDKRTASVLMSWASRPDVGYGGYNRAHSQSLFQRSYAYQPEAVGLQGVPIQVWATKTFTASWERAFDPRQPPLDADLEGPPADEPQKVLSGTLVSHLPVALEDVSLIYGGAAGKVLVYPLGTLAPASEKRIALEQGQQATRISEWLPPLTRNSGTQVQGDDTEGVLIPTDAVVKRALFWGEAAKQDQARNEGLQRLDQGWRLRLQNEAILVGHVPRARLEGADNPSTPDPRLPTWLWLGEVPGPGKQRPSLPGTLFQDTYVRFFVPVKNPRQ